MWAARCLNPLDKPMQTTGWSMPVEWKNMKKLFFFVLCFLSPVPGKHDAMKLPSISFGSHLECQSFSLQANQNGSESPLTTNLSLSTNQCLHCSSWTWHAIISSSTLRPRQLFFVWPYAHHHHPPPPPHHHHRHHHHRHAWAISNLKFITLGSEQHEAHQTNRSKSNMLKRSTEKQDRRAYWDELFKI